MLIHCPTYQFRDGRRVKALNVRKGGKPQRNAQGDITKAAAYQSKDAPTARVEPNRKWFVNTRVISQDSLTAFRDAMTEKAKDTYQVLLKTNKLPMTLLHEMQGINGLKQHKAKMLIESSPFSHVFGPTAQRKRPRLAVTSLGDMAENSEKMLDIYNDRPDQARLPGRNGRHLDDEAELEPELPMAIEPIFNKGKSKRIWNELYKVIDSSDVVIHVLDARDPLGTRCRSVEKYLRTEAPHKHLVFILNKCDLVPNSVCVSISLFHRNSRCQQMNPNAYSQDSFPACSFAFWAMRGCLLHHWKSKTLSRSLILSGDGVTGLCFGVLSYEWPCVT